MWTRPARPSAVPWLATYGALGPPGPEQPAGERRVEAAGHRVLDGRAVLREERPNLERAPRTPGGIRPDDARGRTSTKPGRSASTSAADDSRTATQPGPLSAHWASTIAARGIRSDLGDVRDVRLVDRPVADERRRGEREPCRRCAGRGSRPAAHSCTISPDRGRRRRPRARRGTCPSVGWPANGSSPTGVKIRTR